MQIVKTENDHENLLGDRALVKRRGGGRGGEPTSLGQPGKPSKDQSYTYTKVSRVEGLLVGRESPLTTGVEENWV